jgi:hypothetical protein
MALELLGSGTTVTEYSTRCLNDATHRAPVLPRNAIESFEGIVRQ